MVRLVTADAPDLVALQEVPLWALPLLERWSGMRAFTAVTKRALLGPLARRAQELDPRRVRSNLTGQANAVLVHPRLGAAALRRNVTLNPGSRRERRVCQLVSVRVLGDEILVANFHATPAARDRPLNHRELERVAGLVAGARRCIVCGDFNLRGAGLPGFSPPIGGIDQILVRGLALESPPAPWPAERRTVDGRLLSDHAPVEAVIA